MIVPHCMVSPHKKLAKEKTLMPNRSPIQAKSGLAPAALRNSSNTCAMSPRTWTKKRSSGDFARSVDHC